MTGQYPTISYLPDLGTNVTQVNTTVMTALRRRSSSSPMLWIPYILIGVSCVVFLAVHFWCYHKRNRQRYLRKREEKRVKCGLMERRRITTLMVARYQSDLDFNDIAETEIPRTINGDLHRLSDHSGNEDEDVSVNGNIYDDQLRVDIVPEPVQTSTIITPTPIYPASVRFVPEQMKGANGSVRSSQLASLTPNPSSVQDINLVLDHHNRQPSRRDMSTIPDCLPDRPVLDLGELGHYSRDTSDHHDDEEDAASAPNTPISPCAFNGKSYTTVKASKFPNVIYTTLNQSHSQEKLPRLRDRSKGRKQTKESLGDLYEYNMNVESLTDLEALGANDTHVLSNMDVDTLNYLDCNYKHDSLWRCTPPRASPESDLDSVKASPNVADARRSGKKSTQEVKESGSTPPMSEMHQETDSPGAAITSSILNSNSDTTSNTSDNAGVSIHSNTVANAKADVVTLELDSNVHDLSESNPYDTSLSFPKPKTPISTEKRGTCIEPTLSENANNIGVSFSDDSVGASLSCDPDDDTTKPGTTSSDNKVDRISGPQHYADGLDNQSMAESTPGTEPASSLLTPSLKSLNPRLAFHLTKRKD